jgi:hypothetical protein
MEAVRNAVAAHKATAATLSTAFAVPGGGVFFTIGLFALIFAWGL